jgi:hypothetical protein
LSHLVELNLAEDGLALVLSLAAVAVEHEGVGSKELAMPVVQCLVAFNNDVASEQNNLASHVQTLVFACSRGSRTKVVVL